jgi:hypothetical protein
MSEEVPFESHVLFFKLMYLFLFFILSHIIFLLFAFCSCLKLWDKTELILTPFQFRKLCKSLRYYLRRLHNISNLWSIWIKCYSCPLWWIDSISWRDYTVTYVCPPPTHNMCKVYISLRRNFFPTGYQQRTVNLNFLMWYKICNQRATFILRWNLF